MARERLMRKTILILLSLFLAACATTSSRREPHITLQHDSGTFWRATYEFAAPVRELKFQRPGSGIRARIFEVETPGYKFKKEGDLEVLATDGPPVNVINVRFPEYTMTIPKEYEFFAKFTDGSVAIYTGHLLASAGGKDARAFHFIPRAGESIVVAGKRSSAPVDWIDTIGDGTYVYFGSIKPVETADAISIIDPGLPPWLGAKFRESLPRLFELYARKFGVKLQERPTVLFSYFAGDATGYLDSGGTVPGLIQLAVEGAAWERESTDGLRRLMHFLAHEAVHMWNGQLVNYPDSEDSWMSEGGADALADRALLELGVADEKYFLNEQTTALNECRRGIGAGPLRSAAARGEFQMYYTCGNAIALLTEASVNADLFVFWKTLIERAHATKEKKYFIDDYIAAWRTLGATDADVAALRSLVTDPAGPQNIATMLQQKGVRINESDDVPQAFGQSLARAGLMNVLRENCSRRYGFTATRAGFRLDDPLGCSALPAGGMVKAIGGKDVIRAGQLAWDALHATCGAGASITLRVDDRDISLPCSKPVAARAPYLRIVR
jgi:hypothetical protein